MSYSIKAINQMMQAEFVTLFGSVFEETPSIAQQAWTTRPFKDITDLHQKMVAVVAYEMTPTEQRALILAHPELGARVNMAEASVQEQASAGLSQLTGDDYRRIQDLNTAYRGKFGFPFVVAVRDMSVADVIAALETRLKGDQEREFARSLSEIYKIARFRLADLVEENAQ